MDDYKEFLKGKKITLMGLGLLGRGVGDAKFLAELGAELIVTDLKDAEALADSLSVLKGFKNITYRLGGHDLADFKDRNFILKAAGVPLNSPYIAEAHKNWIPVKMSSSWFAEISRVPVVGITGTRGKSTVTHLLDAIMRAAGMEVLLGGNVRGISTLSLLPEVKKNTIALMELDSWQCQGFGESKMSPTLAVFTTFMPDHLNYYPNLNRYLEDKAQIFLSQTPEDTLVVSTQALPFIKDRYAHEIKSHVVVADPGKFPRGWETHLLGVHNLLNIMCAVEAARVLGIDENIIESCVAEFKAVPGRLQLLRDVHGVKIYNDNNSTTPEATLAALHAIPGSRAIIIMGGADKGSDLRELVTLLPPYAKKLILLAGDGTQRLQTMGSVFANAPVYERLEDAVRDAMGAAEDGDLVLFSPGFASFGMFTNEFDRGDQFVELVKKL